MLPPGKTSANDPTGGVGEDLNNSALDALARKAKGGFQKLSLYFNKAAPVNKPDKENKRPAEAGEEHKRPTKSNKPPNGHKAIDRHKTTNTKLNPKGKRDSSSTSARGKGDGTLRKTAKPSAKAVGGGRNSNRYD